MKTTAALCLALVTVLPHPAYALRITKGFVILPDELEPQALFDGRHFSVRASEEPRFDHKARRAFGLEPFTWRIQFGSTGRIRVGDEKCFPQEGGLVYCGQVTFTSRGFAMPDDWPRSTLFVGELPFSARGYLLVGGRRYDITGDGTVTGMRCLERFECGIDTGHEEWPEITYLTYRFAAAEPPSRLLTTLFSLTILGVLFAHRRIRTNVVS